MIAKLPKWVLYGGAILAFSAGCVNSAALIGVTHLAVSHVTGNVSLLSMAIATLDGKAVLFISAILLSFLFGAILSGVVAHQSPLTLGRRYGAALALESVLLAASVVIYSESHYIAQMTAAMACGLQNAMVATYSGAVIRTTHLTGLTSDLGAAIGNWISGRPVSKKTIAFQAVIWYCFCGGGVVGAWLYAKYSYYAMLLPATIVMVCAVIYTVLSYRLGRFDSTS